MPNTVTEKSIARDRVVCLGYSLVFGMLGMGLLPGLIKPLEEVYGLTHTQMGGLLGTGAGLACIGAIVLGAVADRRGVRCVFSISMIAIAVSALIIWQVQIVALGIAALLFFQLAGASYSVMNGLVFALYGDVHARGLNIFHGLQGIGRLLAPLLIVLVTVLTGTWQTVLLLSSLVHLVFTFLFMGVREPQHPDGHESIVPHRMLQVFLDRRLLLGMVAFMFLSGCEITIITWLANFLEREADFLQSQALIALTIMMSGYTGIRLVLGFTRITVNHRFMVVALGLNVVAYVLLVSVVKHVAGVYIVCLFLGVSFGSFWPCMASLLFQKLRGGRGLLSGVFGLGSALGGVIFLSLVGWLGDCFSLRAALVTMPICAAVFVFIYCYFSMETARDIQ